MKEGQLVWLKWRDAVTRSGWQSEPWFEPAECESVGWISKVARGFVCIVGDRGIGDDDGNRVISIPRAWIMEWCEIR